MCMVDIVCSGSGVIGCSAGACITDGSVVGCVGHGAIVLLRFYNICNVNCGNGGRWLIAHTTSNKSSI